ncbi:hypothetical protein J6590_067050 [Homalodisca vitripennis]|nr:hypothetical protein J6590_067050 [Homalodisca vitripennis]
MYAVYKLETAFQESVTCKIEPNIGVAGVTLFNIACGTNRKVYNESSTYEFYETDPSKDTGGMGRLIAIQQIPSVTTYLTRGSVKVLKYDQYGFSVDFTANVDEYYSPQHMIKQSVVYNIGIKSLGHFYKISI